MDVLMLSRLQFAAATLFHFLFVPLTLGLSVLVAIMETIYVRTGDEEYRRMAKFWGKLFLINFAIGVVTGITLEFQFGTNWSRYSTYVGDVFGALLAIEATVTFFLESTFIAVWAFGWKKLSPKAHAVAIWLVAFASNLSAYWILTANSWMQHPVGLHDPQRPRRGHRLPRGDHAGLRGGDLRAHRQRRLRAGRVLRARHQRLAPAAQPEHVLLHQVLPPRRELRAGGSPRRHGSRPPQRLRGRLGPAGEAGRDGVALGDREQRPDVPAAVAGRAGRAQRRARRCRSPGCSACSPSTTAARR